MSTSLKFFDRITAGVMHIIVVAIQAKPYEPWWKYWGAWKRGVPPGIPLRDIEKTRKSLYMAEGSGLAEATRRCRLWSSRSRARLQRRDKKTAALDASHPGLLKHSDLYRTVCRRKRRFLSGEAPECHPNIFESRRA